MLAFGPACMESRSNFLNFIFRKLLPGFFLGTIFQACRISPPTIDVNGDIGKNFIVNPSFESQSGIDLTGWSGTCLVSTSKYRSGVSALALNQGSVCRSARFPVLAGSNYDGSLFLNGSNLDGERFLGKDFHVTLKVFDDKGSPLKIAAPFLDRERESFRLSKRLESMRSAFLTSVGAFTKITLAAGDYPLDSGWMPEAATSAQLEISYDGPGTLFVDDIAFSYSKWNFPLRQRVLNLVRTPYRFFPPPRFIGEEVLLSSEPSANPSCLRMKASFLIGELNERSDLFYSENSADCTEVVVSKGLICEKLSGEAAVRCRAAAQAPEGYSISAENGRIKLQVSSQDGVSFAFDTLKQIVSEWKAGRTRQVPTVFDYPSVNIRGNTGNYPAPSTSGQPIARIPWLGESRINTIYLNIEPNSPRWWHPSIHSRQVAARISADRKRGSPVQLGILLNPYTGAEDPDYSFPFRVSDSKSIDRVASVIGMFHRIGATQIVLRADDLVPTKPNKRFGYYLATKEDQDRFTTLAEAHLHLIERVRSGLSLPANGSLLFVVPWYNWWFISNALPEAYAYGEELSKGLPAEVPIVWTGPSVRSLFIDEIDIERYRAHVAAQNLILWDNSTFARWHKDFWRDKPRERFASMFEPYDVKIPLDSRGSPLAQSGVLLFFTFSERNRAQLATAGAYWWNPEAYDPERALWTYLLKRFGDRGADSLLLFDQAYFAYRAKWPVLAEHERIDATAELQHLLNEVAENGEPDTPKLVTELRTMVSRLSEIPVKLVEKGVNQHL